jgi:hypothetical protein
MNFNNRYDALINGIDFFFACDLKAVGHGVDFGGCFNRDIGALRRPCFVDEKIAELGDRGGVFENFFIGGGRAM